MNITFHGAAREVTGSCFLLTGKGGNYLVDCGLVQGGREERNREPLPFDSASLSGVLLTHAHLDHSGRIPLLYRQGFRGPVYATGPTIELIEVLWLDTAKIMREESDRANRKRNRRGQPPLEPLYDEKDVKGALSLCEPVGYDELVSRKGVDLVFRNAAHILGAAVLEIWAEEKKIVFTGDMGPFFGVMDGSPPVINDADCVVMESTYGNRDHRSLADTRKEFASVLGEAAAEGGKVLIPSFVVDRAQRVLYELSLLRSNAGPDLPVFFDSPMGKRSTEIYEKYRTVFAGEFQKITLSGKNPFDFPGLTFVSSPQESRDLNDMKRAIIIAGSGMCNGGRILHHLKHSLWKDSTRLVFVGYQARGTLGRRLVQGASSVRVLGEEVVVRAKCATINGFSSHAGRSDLLRWSEQFKNNPLFVVVHGEEESALALASALELAGKKALVPHQGGVLDTSRKALAEEKEIPFPRLSVLREIEGVVRSLQEGIPVKEGSPRYGLLHSALLLLQEARRSDEP